MASYATVYLHLCNGLGYLEDEEGEDHIDLAAAKEEAGKALREVTAAELVQGVLNTGSFVEIEDEDHQPLEIVHFLDVVKLETVCGRDRR